VDLPVCSSTFSTNMLSVCQGVPLAQKPFRMLSQTMVKFNTIEGNRQTGLLARSANKYVSPLIPGITRFFKPHVVKL